MPIAVVDSVHVLSEFADMYPKIKDKRKTIRLVMNDLLQPMHFTSLTSAAGFLSLILAPIPPVRVFGFFVAFGITLAFYLTILFIPAYVVRLSDARIEKLRREDTGGRNILARLLSAVGPWTVGRAKLVAALTVIVVIISAVGISKIQINDNPVRWFRTSHKIRVADRVLNEHFGGTYNAFLVMTKPSTTDERDAFIREADKLLADVKENEGVDLSLRWREIHASSRTTPESEYFDVLIDALMIELDGAVTDAEIYAWEDLLAIVEDAQTRAKYFQSPEALNYVAGMQAALVSDELVGKTMSLADIVKTVHRELREGDETYFTVPGTSNAVAQTLLSYQSSHRPQDLWHFATPDFRKTQIWLQLASGDNKDMAHVTEEVDRYVAAHPLPEGVSLDWAGLTYLNVVWQDDMVNGMRDALIGSFIIVFIMMLVLFRSFWFGLLAMLPLSVTIAFIYGVIGLAGKDYDMPVAVLSSLTLGLSVDFAIHFLQRTRQVYSNTGDWMETVREMFAEPATAISRNAIVIAVGFLPLLASPLVPYNTVGFFLATIMAVSCGVTLVLLPGMMTFLKRRLFGDPGVQEPGVEEPAVETQQDVASGGQEAPVGNTPNAHPEPEGGSTMKAMIPFVFAGTLALFATVNPAHAEDLTDVDAIIDRANVAAYYAGDDGRSEVRMTITDAQGRERRRQFMILRKDLKDGGDQNYAVLFVRPADVRNSVFIVHKHTSKGDDRWLYLPDLDLVKRIAAGDKRTSFVGSDFFYEDVSGRAIDEDTHELVETTDTHYVLKNTPKDPGSVEFTHWTAWIDKKTMIPTKMEYVDSKGEVYRMIEALEVQEFQGYPTVTKMKVTDVRGGGHTISEFRNVEYDLGIPDDVFTERTLRSPSREWFRPKAQ
jgi:predicted RND superfamily exporter protein/outer membrane lipoprotein-sorting protein